MQNCLSCRRERSGQRVCIGWINLELEQVRWVKDREGDEGFEIKCFK